MKKSIINTLLVIFSLAAFSGGSAATFTCPTLKADQIYYYYDWIDQHGNKFKNGEWNKQFWRIWINGDSYLTPKFEEVMTSPLSAHYFASTDTWYLKCTTADLSVGPRANVWIYTNCSISADNTGFECQ